MTRIALITLGCEKNTVDSERYMAQMVAHGARPVQDPHDADVIVVNTCGFIDAAKKESIDALVEAGELRANGTCKAVVAVGCMVERHRDELVDALPEVDLFLPSSQMDRLVPALREHGLVGDPVGLHPGVRLYGGELPHLRYLKASEGCDHGCAFCAIPLMRGRHRSFSLSDIIHEAQLLELQGAREINLVAQDLAHYGRDLRDGTNLVAMLRALIAETAVPWYRLLYLYSAGMTPSLLEAIASEKRILSYLDMPMQHASDRVLRNMRRPERTESIRERVASARQIIPGVAIRTTCIVGFPGETDEDFNTLLEFLEETRFDGVACFAYSPQEGTRAFQMPDDVPDAVKRQRLERVTELQRALASERNQSFIGRTAEAIIDSSHEDGSTGRMWWQAHEIDGAVEIDECLPPGTFAELRIGEVDNDYDLRASLVGVIDAPRQVPPSNTSRRLPTLTSAGSFGR